LAGADGSSGALWADTVAIVARTAVPRGPAVAIRILAVDDDATIRKLLQVNLELEGFEVHLANDGQDGLDKVRELRPDLVLLDIMMPHLTGWEVCEAMQADEELARIPVVFLSARASDADIKRGEAMGAAYMTKPFDPFDLIDLVSDLTSDIADA